MRPSRESARLPPIYSQRVRPLRDRLVRRRKATLRVECIRAVRRSVGALRPVGRDFDIQAPRINPLPLDQSKESTCRCESISEQAIRKRHLRSALPEITFQVGDVGSIPSPAQCHPDHTQDRSYLVQLELRDRVKPGVPVSLPPNEGRNRGPSRAITVPQEAFQDG